MTIDTLPGSSLSRVPLVGLPAIGEVLTTEQLAQRWRGHGVSVLTLENWRRRKRLKGPDYRRLNGRVCYPIAFVQAYEQACTVCLSEQRRAMPPAPVQEHADRPRAQSTPPRNKCAVNGSAKPKRTRTR